MLQHNVIKFDGEFSISLEILLKHTLWCKIDRTNVDFHTKWPTWRCCDYRFLWRIEHNFWHGITNTYSVSCVNELQEVFVDRSGRDKTFKMCKWFECLVMPRPVNEILLYFDYSHRTIMGHPQLWIISIWIEWWTVWLIIVTKWPIIVQWLYTTTNVVVLCQKLSPIHQSKP